MKLFINACVRKGSRTKKLADRILSIDAEPYDEIVLNEIDFPVADEDFLNFRDRLISGRNFGDPAFSLARRFADAEEIVIAAPFWDFSFPASLKQFFEQINVLGITFRYTSEGIPEGLCKAKRLTYITAAGGRSVPDEFGFGYVKTLATVFYGIQDVRLIKAEGLDIDGADVEGILTETLKKAVKDAAESEAENACESKA